MPLHVYCPLGCVIGMPSIYAGRVVRCPKCHSAIRIPQIPDDMLDYPDPIRCRARIARRIGHGENREKSKAPLPAPADDVVSTSRRPVEPTPTGPVSTESTSAELISGLVLKPASNPIMESTATDESSSSEQEVQRSKERLPNTNSERRIVALVFALCLSFFGIANIVPAIYYWYHWTQLAEPTLLARWIFIQIFVGSILLIFAIYLARIPVWTSMRAVSIAMLVVAFVFGFISSGLLFGGAHISLTEFLGIPQTLNRQACIWCVGMLCLATLMSYWGGKESSNWQRSWQRSKLVPKEILSNSTA